MIQTDFAADVAKYVEEAKGKMDEAFRAIATEAVSKVKELTPVNTGFLRANWVDVLGEDAVPSPSASQNTGEAIAQAHVGDTIYVVNPVPYARRIEYGFVGQDSLGRHYNQPGRHMVGQTVADLPSIAKDVVKRFEE